MPDNLLLGFSGTALVAALVVAVAGTRERAAVPTPPAPDPPPATARLYPDILSVRDAAHRDGTWYLADLPGHAIHILDSDGSISSFGREGRGPGEFESVHRVAVNSTQVAALQVSEPGIDLFRHDGSFVRRLIPPGGCDAGRYVDVVGVGDGWVALRQCMSPRGMGYRIEATAPDGDLRVVVAEALPVDRTSFAVRFPVLAADSRVVLVGEGQSGCMRMYSAETFALTESTCIRGVGRSAMPTETLERLRSRAAGRVEIPDSMPWFVGLEWQRDGDLLVQTIDGAQAVTWLAVDARTMHSDSGLPMGRGRTPASFVDYPHQLNVWERMEGTYLELVSLDVRQ